MYFSFTNASATFQSIMNYIFEDLIFKEQVIIYLDNILIFGNNEEEYKTIVLKVLLKLLNNNLFAKADFPDAVPMLPTSVPAADE